MLKRELFYTIRPQLQHKNAIVITGMRQVGKTTLMRQLYDDFEGKRLWFDLYNPLDQMVFENVDYDSIYNDLVSLSLLLAARNGNLLDVSKLSSELGVNRVKMYNYLEFLESIFFLRLLPKYSKSIDRGVSGGKKVYFSDTGILNKEIAFEVKQQAVETDYKKLRNLAGELGITTHYVISNALSDIENTVYPWFL